MGTEPTTCNICDAPITDRFVDGATRQGPWAIMCMPCVEQHGRGLGTGHGQAYSKTPDSQWIKVAG